MVDIPRPGQPVRGSKTGAPIMALFDLLGRNWSMGIVWVLSEIGPCTFRELQSQCESISPAALNMRLKELQVACFVERVADGYVLTPLGKELYEDLVPLGALAKKWGEELLSQPNK